MKSSLCMKLHSIIVIADVTLSAQTRHVRASYHVWEVVYFWYWRASDVFWFAAVPEWFAAGAFGLVTIFTLLLRNVPALQSNLLYEVSCTCLLFIYYLPSSSLFFFYFVCSRCCKWCAENPYKLYLKDLSSCTLFSKCSLVMWICFEFRAVLQDISYLC